jgi:hypothetical protein
MISLATQFKSPLLEHLEVVVLQLELLDMEQEWSVAFLRRLVHYCIFSLGEGLLSISEDGMVVVML